MNELERIFDLTGPPLPDLVEGVDYFPDDCDTGSLGGKCSAEARRERGEGMFDPEWQAKYNGAYSPNNPFKDPEFQRTMPRHSKGVITAEAHKMGGIASTSILYKCNDCEMITKIGGITTHIRSSKHSGYERVVNGN